LCGGVGSTDPAFRVLAAEHRDRYVGQPSSQDHRARRCTTSIEQQTQGSGAALCRPKGWITAIQHCLQAIGHKETSLCRTYIVDLEEKIVSNTDKARARTTALKGARTPRIVISTDLARGVHAPLAPARRVPIDGQQTTRQTSIHPEINKAASV